MLESLDRLYLHVLKALAALGGLLVVLSVGLVIVNVLSRAVGYGQFHLTVAAVEYILLYFTLLSAPYLLHIRGHVLVDFGVKNLQGVPRLVLETMIYIACLVVCSIFVVISILLMIEAIRRGTFDVRSVDVPYWALYVLFPPSFGLMGIEFLRFIFRRGSLYGDREPEGGL